MNTSHSTVSGSLQRPTIQVHKLLEWCELLQYNFFKEIAVKLPYNDPPDADNSPVIQQQQGKQSQFRIIYPFPPLSKR